jgi:hypothetical protein
MSLVFSISGTEHFKLKTMTNFLSHPAKAKPVKLSGVIKNLRVTQKWASFVFTESDQTKMGVVAIVASLAGASGPAISTASNANALNEEASFLEFDLDGQPVRGWVWRNPFNEGDQVEVAAEWMEGHWEAYGIKRPKDRTIALYPHCSRGKATHVKNVFKWYWIFSGGFVIGLAILILCVAAINGDLTNIKKLANVAPYYLYMSVGSMAFFALAFWSMTRKWMPFVNLAEKIFRVLDMPDPSNIDLVKSSKLQRTDHDPYEFGIFYFRY